MGRKEPSVTFLTRSGPVTVDWEGSRLIMDFPAFPLSPAEAPPALEEGLGARPRAVFRAMDWVCVFKAEDSIRSLFPRFEALGRQSE